MAGHSKFANIRHKKEKMDSQRGKIFTKLGREIAVAVKQGGSDPASNARLKEVVSKAKSANMPGDTIERSIKKAAGELDGVNYEAITYEGYGPNGIAIIARALTDNRNRTVANVRNAFTKGGGNLGAQGSVVFQFDEIGQIAVEAAEGIDADELEMLAIEAGASDFIASHEGYEITSAPQDFSNLCNALEAANIPVLSAEITMQPKIYGQLTNPDDIKGMNKLLDLLEDDDDVQDVYHNWEE